MEIRNTPALCEVGDAVLATDVLLLDEFHTTHKFVKFHPDHPTSVLGVRRWNGEKTVPVEKPESWVFAFGEYQLTTGEVVHAWRRDQ